AGIVVHGPDTQIVLINERAQQILGIHADHLLCKTPHEPDWFFTHRDGRRLDRDEYPAIRVLKSGHPLENMTYGIRRPGSDDVVWVLVNAVPDFDTDGSLRQIVVTSIDVSKQIEAETLAQELNEQLNHQERLAAIGQLAAGIAHDFNNILAVIALQVPMLARVRMLTERDHNRLDVIQAQVSHAARLIQQILDFSRRAVLERHPLDLAPFLRDQIALLARTLPETIDVGLDCEPGQHLALVDLPRMQQLVMNLAVNARDAMPSGGHLRFSLSSMPRPPRPGLTGGRWLRLIVADTGGGIPAHNLPHIFEPFFTTKAPGQGSGLGLAQVHGIVMQHGGEIEVESEEGTGTRFVLFLPALAEKGDDHPSTEGDLTVGDGRTILVVEDNPDLLVALREIVELLGYRAVTAGNGKEALVVLDDDPTAVDLVLSDFVMPEMGGAALLDAMRQRALETPVLILSGHPLDAELPDLTERGLAGWLLKPVDIELLSKTLAQILTK
ncbi:MAG: response regulator, partial [Caldilineaceae bacterium]|nr:response regulator [Caldilineaceae bacterium]